MCYFIPPEIWSIIFEFSHPESLFNLIKVCKKFRELIKDRCHRWNNGIFYVNGKRLTLRIFGKETVFITKKSVGYIELILDQFRKRSATIPQLIGDSNGEETINGVLVQGYIKRGELKTNQYYKIQNKLLIIAIQKKKIRMYSSQKGHLFTMNFKDINECKIKWSLVLEKGLRGRTKEKVTEELVRCVTDGYSISVKGSIEFCFKRKPLSKFL